MTFQASDGKGKQFLDLLDDNFNIIELAYTKGGPWLQVFGHSNSLCTCATRAITNHAPIGEYQLRFFPNEDFKYLYDNYPIESRRHILHECSRFNGYWNPRRDSLNHFVMFLVTNPKAFAFTDYFCSSASKTQPFSFFSHLSISSFFYFFFPFLFFFPSPSLSLSF